MLQEVGLPPVEQEYGVAKVLLIGRLLPRLDLVAGGVSARVEESLGLHDAAVYTLLRAPHVAAGAGADTRRGS